MIWKYKRQSVVATSFCEVGSVASCVATKEEVWLSLLMMDLLVHVNAVTININVNNQSAIDAAQN